MTSSSKEKLKGSPMDAINRLNICDTVEFMASATERDLMLIT